MTAPTVAEIEAIIDKAHELAGLTGSEILLAISHNSYMHTYTTPKLAALVQEAQGKALLLKCLYDAKKLELDPEKLQQAAALPPEEALRHTPRTFEGLVFERDEDRRHALLVQLFPALRTAFLGATLPGNKAGEEGILVVCTLAEQMLCMASPAFSPFLGTEGRELLTALLSDQSPNHVGAVLRKRSD